VVCTGQRARAWPADLSNRRRWTRGRRAVVELLAVLDTAGVFGRGRCARCPGLVYVHDPGARKPSLLRFATVVARLADPAVVARAIRHNHADTAGQYVIALSAAARLTCQYAHD